MTISSDGISTNGISDLNGISLEGGISGTGSNVVESTRITEKEEIRLTEGEEIRETEA